MAVWIGLDEYPGTLATEPEEQDWVCDRDGSRFHVGQEKREGGRKGTAASRRTNKKENHKRKTKTEEKEKQDRKKKKGEEKRTIMMYRAGRIDNVTVMGGAMEGPWTTTNDNTTWGPS